VSLAGEVVEEELGRVGKEELIAGSGEDQLGHRETIPEERDKEEDTDQW
jgi:hypothetical protein